MRRVPVLAAAVAVVVAFAAAIAVPGGAPTGSAAPAGGTRPPTTAPDPGPARPGARAALAGRAGASCAGGWSARCDPRERSVAELAARLRGAPRGRPRPRQDRAAAVRAGVAAARRMQAELCPEARRSTCNLAVASAAVRRQWRTMPTTPSRHHEAEVLTAVGARLGMTPTEVRNSVRAEFDARLIRALDAGGLSRRTYRLALTCFDELRGCERLPARGT